MWSLECITVINVKCLVIIGVKKIILLPYILLM